MAPTDDTRTPSRSSSDKKRPHIAILYHYMYPDDVVSAHHLHGLAVDLASKGWNVEALPCNRGCRNERLSYKSKEMREGVRYNRVWRPRFPQRSFIGRLFNSFWMMTAWTQIAFRVAKQQPDVVLIGTDPVFAVLVAIPLKLFGNKIRIAHWCFDLHPEAAMANGMMSSSNLLMWLIRKIMRASYFHCDVIADIGPCMRSLLRQYNHSAMEVELTPWALVEPQHRIEPDLKTRYELFGKAKLTILYSGNFGEAHSFKELLTVARLLRTTPEIHFCFAARGNRFEELQNSIGPEDCNVSIARFASIEELERRLGAADIHMVSLKPEWSGVAVPSKFFGSLAMGRPVLFAGARESAIGQWIKKHEVGWVVDSENPSQIAEELRLLAEAPSVIRRLQIQAHSVYFKNFSRSTVVEEWHSILCRLIDNYE